MLGVVNRQVETESSQDSIQTSIQYLRDSK